MARVRVGGSPYGVAVDRTSNRILVTNQHGDDISAIDADTLEVIRTIAVGRYPEAVLGIDGKGYVANWFSGDLSILDLVTGTRGSQHFRLGEGPRSMAFTDADLWRNSMSSRMRALIAIACLATMTACDDRKQDREIGSSDEVDANIKTPQSWIRRNDDTDPAIWLASKGLDAAFGRRPNRRTRARRAFQTAATRFLESDRMVANRTAQLAEMLAEDGKPEEPAALIEGLASVVDPKHGKETYGELCQFYFTLRHGGADRDAALMQLSARYGSPGRSVEKTP